MLRPRRLAALSLALCLPLAACGDDTKAGPATPFNASLSDETRVDQLDETQKNTLCQEAGAWYATQVSAALEKRLACYGFALAFAGGNAQACNQFANQCLASNEGLEASSEVECDLTRLEGCTATVGELETCFTETATRVRQVASALSCSSSASQLQGLDAPIAACATVKTKCPALFDEEEDGEL